MRPGIAACEGDLELKNRLVSGGFRNKKAGKRRERLMKTNPLRIISGAEHG